MNLYDHIQNKKSFDGIITGQPATQALPRDIGAVHEWLLAYGTTTVGGPTEANMLLEIESLEIIVNNIDWTKVKLATLFMLEKFWGETISDGFIPLRFTQLSRRRIGGAESTALVTDAHPEIKVRVNTLNNAGQTMSLTTYLTKEGIGQQARERARVAPEEVARPIIKYREFVHDILSSGTTENTLDYENGGERIRGIHLVGDNITKVVINYNGQERWSFASKAMLDRILVSNGKVPQANHWHFVPEAFNGSVNAAIDLKNGINMDELQFEIYTSNTNDITVIVEEYATPELRRPLSQAA